MGVKSSSLKVQSDLDNLALIRSFIEQVAEEIGLSSLAISGIRLAVDEACANIIIHGYGSERGDIDITVSTGANEMVVILDDNAHQYDSLQETPAISRNTPLSDRLPGGMGVMLIKQNTDRAKYLARAGGGNRLILTCFLGDIAELVNSADIL